MRPSFRTALVVLIALTALSCDHLPWAKPAAEPLAGRWQGRMKLRWREHWLVVDFFPDPKGTRGRLDFAVQRVLDNHLFVSDEPPHVKFRSAARGRSLLFLGTREKDEIRGTLRFEELDVQLEVPFTLYRLGTTTHPPYAEKEVRVENDRVALGGSLLVPPGQGPHPAVILIPAYDSRKGEMSREDFRFYGDLFARGGIAALLYDQRRFVPSQNAKQSVETLESRASDALAAVELLKRRPEIDPGKIGLWGFELGGIVAPMAAARSKDAAFVISISSPGVPYPELRVHALGEHLHGMGFSYGDVNDAMDAFQRALEYDRKGGDAAAMQRFLDQARKTRWAPYAELPKKVWRPKLDPFMCCDDQYPDPTQFWEQVDVPVLLVYGTRDHLFAARESADRVEAALKRRGNRDVTIKLYGADHRIQQAQWFPQEVQAWLVKKMKGVG